MKWQQGQALSRAEWIFLSRYVRVACEELSENPAMPEAGSYVVVLEAVLAVRALRADLGAGLDRYDLGNIGVPDVPSFDERCFNAELVPLIFSEGIRRAREVAHAEEARVRRLLLIRALRDEIVSDAMALHGVLEPFLPALFRLAARGNSQPCWNNCNLDRSGKAGNSSHRLILPHRASLAGSAFAGTRTV
jgi:hypothetical protein